MSPFQPIFREKIEKKEKKIWKNTFEKNILKKNIDNINS